MTDLIIKEIETESELKEVLELCYKILGTKNANGIKTKRLPKMFSNTTKVSRFASLYAFIKSLTVANGIKFIF